MDRSLLVKDSVKKQSKILVPLIVQILTAFPKVKNLLYVHVTVYVNNRM